MSNSSLPGHIVLVVGDIKSGREQERFARYFSQRNVGYFPNSGIIGSECNLFFTFTFSQLV